MDAKALTARTASLLSLTCGLCTVSAAQAPVAKHGFTPADWYKVTTVSTPVLSPDGGKVAFTVTTVRETENRRHSEVWVAATSGGDAARYTSPAFESSNPRFSDDGKILYFTSQRPGGGRGTTWALHMDQPAGEAYQPAGEPQIRAGSSPADMSFAITTTGAGRGGGRGGRGGGRGGAATDSVATDSASANDPYGRMQPISRPPYNAITHPENPARYDGRHVVDMLYKANGQPQFIAGRRTRLRRTPPAPPRSISSVRVRRAFSSPRPTTRTATPRCRRTVSGSPSSPTRGCGRTPR